MGIESLSGRLLSMNCRRASSQMFMFAGSLLPVGLRLTKHDSLARGTSWWLLRRVAIRRNVLVHGLPGRRFNR